MRNRHIYADMPVDYIGNGVADWHFHLMFCCQFDQCWCAQCAFTDTSARRHNICCISILPATKDPLNSGRLKRQSFNLLVNRTRIHFICLVLNFPHTSLQPGTCKIFPTVTSSLWLRPHNTCRKSYAISNHTSVTMLSLIHI